MGMRIQIWMVLLCVGGAGAARGCTQSCSNVASKVKWTQGNVTGNITSTIAGSRMQLLTATEDCHFHAFSRSESAQCLLNKQRDILFVGGSTLLGMSFGILPWYNSSVGKALKFNPMEFFEPVCMYSCDRVLNAADDMFGAEIGINSAGEIMHKSSVIQGDTDSENSGMAKHMLNSAPKRTSINDWYTRLGYLRARSWAEAHRILDSLEVTGRSQDSIALVINIGLWYAYCFESQGVYCEETGLNDIGLHTGDSAYLYTAFMSELKQWSRRVRKDFPNYTIYFMDFVDDGATSLPGLNNIIQITGSAYGKVVYFSQMVVARNYLDYHIGHPYLVYLMWAYMRILSTECATWTLNECTDELVMTQGCFANRTFNGDWYTPYYSSCDFTAFPTPTNASQKLPTPAPDAVFFDTRNIWATTYGSSVASKIYLQSDTITSSVYSSNQNPKTTTTTAEKLMPWGYTGTQVALVIASVLIIVVKLTREGLTDLERLMRELRSWVCSIRCKKRTRAGKGNFPTGMEDMQADHETKNETPNHRTVHPDIFHLPRKSNPWGHIAGLDGARFAASLHIVGGHFFLYTPRPTTREYILNWGFTWVPWFMMLSGFVLAYSSFRRKTMKPPTPYEFSERTIPNLSDDMVEAQEYPQDRSKENRVAIQTLDVFDLEFARKRIMSIYPVYALGLFVAFQVAVSEKDWMQYASWYPLLSSCTLTQAWFPNVSETVLQSHCWFLSCILPFWAAHNFIQEHMQSLSIRSLTAVMLVLGFAGWLVVIIPAMAGVDLTWYNDHQTGSFQTWADTLVVLLKFHPIFYLHIYVLGVGAACLYKHCTELEAPPPYLTYGTSFGFLVLILIFSIPDLQLPAYRLSARLGALAPLHVLILVGMAIGKDPVVKLLSVWPLQILGTVSYAQYVFQFIAFDIWKGFLDLGFFIFLLALSVLATFIADMFGAKNPKVFDVSFRRATLLVLASIFVWSILPNNARNSIFGLESYNSQTKTLTPLYAPITDYSFDVRLNLTAKGYLDGLHKDYTIINPSILSVNGSIVVAARRHKYTVSTGPSASLGNKMLTTITWHSDIVLGLLDSTLSPKAQLTKLKVTPFKDSSITSWVPCAEPPVYHSDNDSYTQTVVTGPQDPRLLIRYNQLFLTFFSTTPTLFSTTPTLTVCPNISGTLGNLYITEALSLDSFGKEFATQAQSLTLNGSQKYEKNWMAFSVSSGFSNTLFMRYISPLSIVQLTQSSKDIFGVQHYSQAKLDNTTSLGLSSNVLGVDIHGGSTALLVTWPSVQPFFLAVFHTVSNAKHYANYLVQFQVTPPYHVLAVSRPLPLIKGASTCPTFASGLEAVTLFDDDMIAVSYGSCDDESRVLLLDLRDLLDYFTTSPFQEDDLPIED